ncbi:MAG: carbamoyl-phosphate synthase large subunit, partial [Elusimicrobiota bacterium]
VEAETLRLVSRPNPKRVFAVYSALLDGASIEDLYHLSGIDPWFLREISRAAVLERELRRRPSQWPRRLAHARRMGFSERQFGALAGVTAALVQREARRQGLEASFAEVDTCAAEFEAETPYFYSTFHGQGDDRELPSQSRKIIVLGSGPNRIGQGIEFDYACVHAAEAIRELGYQAIMINSNPETVSTDYDTADRLYFEPVHLEDVLRVARHEKRGLAGILLGFAGQTPLNMAHALLEELGQPMLLGTSVAHIDMAEDRKKFARFLRACGIKHPRWAVLTGMADARRYLSSSRRLNFPVLVRPSYVLGGRGMRIFFETSAFEEHLKAWPWPRTGKTEIYIDEFLEDAIELDVDVVADGTRGVVCGVMEHIEETGVHSGDSSCVWPPMTISKRRIEEVEKVSLLIARELKIKGLLNIQYAIYRGGLYVIEANPRASRTAPFISKARGVPWAKIAAKACLGQSLEELLKPYRVLLSRPARWHAIKTPVFSWERFEGADVVLGPEMRSTGETMALGRSFVEALVKAQSFSHAKPPSPKSQILVSLKNEDKPKFLSLTKRFFDL